jgi:hypothetical protein
VSETEFVEKDVDENQQRKNKNARAVTQNFFKIVFMVR